MKIEGSYFLPFDVNANPVRISQGWNGPWSHFLQRREVPKFPGVYIETDLIHAVDFALPLNSQVLAARDGRVLDYWLNSNWFYEGLDSEIGNNPPSRATNYMFIEHEDMTLGLYSHLGEYELLRRDQWIKQGEVIGLTGQSGWIGKIPHLHFQVMSEDFKKTLPVKFVNYNGSLEHSELSDKNLLYSL